jgi:hypothetical protein
MTCNKSSISQIKSTIDGHRVDKWYDIFIFLMCFSRYETNNFLIPLITGHGFSQGSLHSGSFA